MSFEYNLAQTLHPGGISQGIREAFGFWYTLYAPPQIMRVELKRDGPVAQECDEIIKKARKEKSGRLRVTKSENVIDENGHRVEAFAYERGRYEVGGTLYAALVVVFPEKVYVLLIRSDVTTAWHNLFPDIGTQQDWRVLRKCVERFSPKSGCHRHVIDTQSAYHDAVATSATAYLGQSGAFQQHDLNVLQDMDVAMLHLIDLCAVISLNPVLPANLVPRMIHVIYTQDADDLEEVQRVFKALDFSIGEQPPGLYVPSIAMNGKSSMDMWRKSSRFTYITYTKAQDIDRIFAAMSQGQTLNTAHFRELFPYPLVIVGSSIWSNQNCVEIDMRGLRFSNEDLFVARKYLATLLAEYDRLMSEFTKTWEQSSRAYETAVTPYPQLWFQSFHLAVGTTIFSASTALMDYLQLARDADARRLRLRTDRAKQYADAIDRLKSATKEAPWLYCQKPQTLADAFTLLKEDYDAFLQKKDDQSVLAFTQDSLIRFAKLDREEIDDFISKLKENHLLSSRTHPISFANRAQHRFICIAARLITPTVESRTEDVL